VLRRAVSRVASLVGWFRCAPAERVVRVLAGWVSQVRRKPKEYFSPSPSEAQMMPRLLLLEIGDAIRALCHQSRSKTISLRGRTNCRTKRRTIGPGSRLRSLFPGEPDEGMGGRCPGLFQCRASFMSAGDALPDSLPHSYGHASDRRLRFGFRCGSAGLRPSERHGRQFLPRASGSAATRLGRIGSMSPGRNWSVLDAPPVLRFRNRDAT